MTMIWIPTGNLAQTEIDIQIEALKYEIATKEKALKEYLNTTITYRKQIGTLERSLLTLKKKKVKAVSFSEYQEIKMSLWADSCKLAEITDEITKIKKYIENAEKEIQSLQKDRDKNATSILEFNHEKRRS